MAAALTFFRVRMELLRRPAARGRLEGTVATSSGRQTGCQSSDAGVGLVQELVEDRVAGAPEEPIVADAAEEDVGGGVVEDGARAEADGAVVEGAAGDAADALGVGAGPGPLLHDRAEGGGVGVVGGGPGDEEVVAGEAAVEVVGAAAA